MKTDKSTDESDFSENDIPELNSLKLLNQKQTSDILTVVAKMMREKVLTIRSGGWETASDVNAIDSVNQ